MPVGAVIANHLRNAWNASSYTRSGAALTEGGQSILSNEWKRLATFAPYGIGIGLAIGGGIGALVGLKNRGVEETKKQAAWRGAKKGLAWGAITGLVIGVAGHPPLFLRDGAVQGAKDALTGYDITLSGKELAKYEKTAALSQILKSSGEVMESVGLLGGATGVKVSAMLDSRKLEETTDPEERRKLKNARAAKNIIAMYLFFRIVGKRGRNLAENFPGLMRSSAPDIAGSPITLISKLFTDPGDFVNTAKRIFRGYK